MSGAPSTTRAMMQKANEWTAIYFTASIVGLSGLIITSHFLAVILTNPNPNGRGMLPRSFIKTARCVPILSYWICLIEFPSRFVRSRLLRKVPFFPSAGHGLVFSLYIVINITLLLQNLDLSLSRNWASRMGW
jgi:hypothetical protein